MADAKTVFAVLVEGHAELQEALSWASEQPLLAFDFETTGIDYLTDRVRLLQLGTAEGGYAIPDVFTGPVYEFLDGYNGRLVAHNGVSFDLDFMRPYAPNVCSRPDRLDDTLVMARVLWPGEKAALEFVAERFYGPSAHEGKAALQQAFKDGGWSYDTIPIDHPAYWQYGCQDVVSTASIFPIMNDMLDERGLRSTYELELVIAYVLREAERTGIKVDREHLAELRTQWGTEATDLYHTFEQKWGLPPTSSGGPLGEAMKAAGVPLKQRTTTGQWSTSAKTLESVADHQMVKDLLEYREVAKLSGTYLHGVDTYSERDGRIHCSFEAMGARTGRMSVRRPSLQNYPARSERGKEVRNLLVAGEGNVLISADFSGQEVKNIAQLSGDERLIGVINRKEDPFIYVANALFPNNPITDKGDPRRAQMKELVYASCYGAGARRIGEVLGVSEEEAAGLKRKFFEQFPSIQKFSSDIVTGAKLADAPHTRSLFGRYVPGRPGKEYQLVNATIQSTAACQMKLAAEAMYFNGISQYLRLVIHDEVVLEVPEDLVDEVVELVVDCMESAGGDVFTVKHKSDVVIGYRFGELK